MCIFNDDTQNYLFCRLQLVVDTELNEPTIQISIKVPKVVKSMNNKKLSKNFGD